MKWSCWKKEASLALSLSLFLSLASCQFSGVSFSYLQD